MSDHAVLRWLERVEGVNVEGIRRRIADAVQRGADLQATGVRLDGVTFKLQYNPGEAVVTTTHSPYARAHLAEPRLDAAERERLRSESSPLVLLRFSASEIAASMGVEAD
ncbi:hypothetical protein [Devosia sp.]|uniref:hypothetical protein n=1 Tax=Devosia sp. TaxID=1871048 RepID=UPI001ACB6E49|nr:hypothetical protein [Devosia sp.]MBN9333881.1 hypothetical protein [Devosia sp.]